MATLTCPACNIEMTRHAAKIVEPRGESEKVDPELAGVVLERHQCPGCGESGTTLSTSNEDE